MKPFLWSKRCRRKPVGASLLELALFFFGTGTFVLNSSALSVPQPGLGADCLQTLPTLEEGSAPVYGLCSKGQEGVSILSFHTLERAAGPGLSPLQLDEEQENWIILWESNSTDGELTQEACQEAEDTSSGRFFGTCSARYSHVLQGFAATFTRTQLAAFLSAYKGQVASVHEDTPISVSSAQRLAPWALDRMDQSALPLDNSFTFYNLGTGVNAYIVDTGIRVTHEEFRYADGRSGSRATEVYSSLTSGAVGQDCNGHGTHVAGTVGGLTYGPAKNVTLLAVRSLECLGNGTVSQVIDGLDWVKANHQPPAVAVMALGGDAQSALDLAVHNLVLSGVNVMVAAGNEDTDACTKSPAREPLATTVAATDIDDQRLWIASGVASNYGACVDIWAPGTNIQSASHISDTATEFRSGTSQSAPFVAGAAALYLQNVTGATPADVETELEIWGSWGVITETAQSSQTGVRLLNTSANVLLNLIQSVPAVADPTYALITGGPGGFGPYNFSLHLIQAPPSNVQVWVSLTDAARGSVAPSSLLFTPYNWAVPQQVQLQVLQGAWATARSSEFYVDFLLSSASTMFNGQRPQVWVADKKGDTLAYPKVVSSLPFSDTGDTYHFENTFNVTCGNVNTAGRDVLYYFAPATDATITISLCGSQDTIEPFDTTLLVVTNLAVGNQLLRPVACNTNYCGGFSQITMNVTAGVAYGIIVDGGEGQFGTYAINITSPQDQLQGQLPPSGYGQLWVPITPPDLLASSGLPAAVIAWQTSPLVGPPFPPAPPPPPTPSTGTVAGPPAPTVVPVLLGFEGASTPGVEPLAAGPYFTPVQLAPDAGNPATVSTSTSGAFLEPPAAALPPSRIVSVTSPSISPPPQAMPPVQPSSILQPGTPSIGRRLQGAIVEGAR